jgi:hypothetical protein
MNQKSPFQTVDHDKSNQGGFGNMEIWKTPMNPNLFHDLSRPEVVVVNLDDFVDLSSSKAVQTTSRTSHV